MERGSSPGELPREKSVEVVGAKIYCDCAKVELGGEGQRKSWNIAGEPLKRAATERRREISQPTEESFKT